MALDLNAEIKHQEEQLAICIREINERLQLKANIEGAHKILTLLRDKEIELAKTAEVKVEEVVKAVEAEVVPGAEAQR